MGRIELTNVCRKGGRLYYRRKVAGKDQYVRLPALDDPRFAEEYQRVHRTTAERTKPLAGTMASLVAEFRASAEFRNIPSPVTRANLTRYLDAIATEHGSKSVRALSRVDVLRERDKLADKPGKANNWLNTLRRLLGFAVDRGLRTVNPAAGIKPLPIGERQPWPADVLSRALGAATPMTRLAIVTGLCSGARIGDCIRMQHGWHDGQTMEFRTSKNRTDVAVPMHPFWVEEMSKLPRRAVTILYDRTGRPFKSTKALQERIRDLLNSIGAAGYSFHGLRKNAACYLAELGLSDTEIGSIVAMTPQTVRHYTKQKRAFMIAKGAAARIKRGDVVPLKGGQTAGRAK